MTTPPNPVPRRLGASLATAVLLLLPACQKQDGFNKADTNHDGRISFAEFERYMDESIFAANDADGDGKVTLAESKAANPGSDPKKFRQADANHDGVITPAEAKAYYQKTGDLKKLFASIDANHDGFISREEAVAFYDKVATQPGSTRLQKLSNAAKP